MEVDLSFEEFGKDKNGNPSIYVTNNLTGKGIGFIYYRNEIEEFTFDLSNKKDAMTANGMLAVSEYLEYANETFKKLNELEERADDLIERIYDLIEEYDTLRNED